VSTPVEREIGAKALLGHLKPGMIGNGQKQMNRGYIHD